MRHLLFIFFLLAFTVSCKGCDTKSEAGEEPHDVSDSKDIHHDDVQDEVDTNDDTHDEVDTNDDLADGDDPNCPEASERTTVCEGSTCVDIAWIPAFTHKLSGQTKENLIEAQILPTHGNRWFVASQKGIISTFTNDSQTIQAVDISNQLWTGHPEAGLLGFAFPPNFDENPVVYLSYTTEAVDDTTDALFSSVVTKMPVDTSSWTFGKSQEEIILHVDQPAGNHNGGKIAFGPDNMLYISWGDGGGSDNQYENGQNKQTLLGTIVRIDVLGDSASPYTIPSDNPFVGTSGADEIYAYGLRNVWKFSFDRQTGKLVAADVGQNDYEEVNIIEPGNNYGWSLKEGFHCFDAPEPCDSLEVTDPIWEYGHGRGRSITGGYVYRGDAIPQLQGDYIVADYITGRIWKLHNEGTIPWSSKELFHTNFYISGFTEGPSGELYLFNHQPAEGAAILKLSPIPDACQP